MSQVVLQGSTRLALLVVVLLVVPGAASAISAQPAVPSVTHGVVVGDVTTRSAVLWARADRAATLNVTLSGGGHGPVARVAVEAADDYTGKVVLDRLHPGTTYRYRVWLSLGARGVAHGPAVRGSFRTPPAEDTAAPVRLAFGTAAVTSWTEAKRWFNFGTLEIAADGQLIAGIVDTAGEQRFALELRPS